MVREALRLQPVIPLVGRALYEPMNVLGYEVPAEVVIAPSIYLLHRRGATYPHPHVFDPDRFAASKPSPSSGFRLAEGFVSASAPRSLCTK
ncbi:MAG: cytochrome P450 [Polyangiaceae bacterium]